MIRGLCVIDVNVVKPEAEPRNYVMDLIKKFIAICGINHLKSHKKISQIKTTRYKFLRPLFKSIYNIAIYDTANIYSGLHQDLEAADDRKYQKMR